MATGSGLNETVAALAFATPPGPGSRYAATPSSGSIFAGSASIPIAASVGLLDSSRECAQPDFEKPARRVAVVLTISEQEKPSQDSAGQMPRPGRTVVYCGADAQVSNTTSRTAATAATSGAGSDPTQHSQVRPCQPGQITP